MSSLDPSSTPIAATQVDVVAHSMGGLVWRKYMANQLWNFIRPDNLGKGDVHKLILLDSPQRGSPWSNIITPIVSIPLIGSVIDAFLSWKGACMRCGGVEEMRPSQLRGLAGLDVPTHAIYGTGASDFVDQGWFPSQSSVVNCLGRRPESGVMWNVPRAAAWLANIPFLDFLSVVFSAERYDIMVSESSQKAGLNGACTTHFGGLAGFHTFNILSCAVSTAVKDLLNAKTTSPSFCNPLPQNPGTLPDVNGPDLPDYGEAFFCQEIGGIEECSINLDAPVLRASAVGNSEILATVTGDNGFVPVTVLFASSHDLQIDDEAPFEVILYVPPTAIGPLQIRALALDAANNLAVSREIEDFVTVPADMTQLLSRTKTLSLFAYATTGTVGALGRFADGIDRDLPGGFPGLSFTATDPTIASVDANGLVVGHRTGSTTVTVSFDGGGKGVPLDTTVTIDVITVPADFDSDSDVDLMDLAGFVGCLDGPVAEDGVMALLDCRDFFDIDGDLDIDLRDFGVFQQSFNPTK